MLIDIELLQPQIGDARVYIRQQRTLGQALLLLIQNARQHQAALQHLNLLFQVTFRLQTAIEPVFDPNILLEQGVALFGGGDQLLTQLAVDVQLLADQPIVLDIGGVFRILRLFGGFFRQRQALAVDELLQQLHRPIQRVDMHRGVIALFLQQIL